MNQSNNQNDDNLTRFMVGLGTCLAALGKILWYGIKRINLKSTRTLMVCAIIVLSAFTFSFGDFFHLKVANFLWGVLFTQNVVSYLETIPVYWHFLALMLFEGILILVSMGLGSFLERSKYQRDLKEINLQSATKTPPKLVDVVPRKDNRVVLTIRAKGIGVDRFEAKRGDLESAFESKIEAIRQSKDRRHLEIELLKKDLSNVVSYYDFEDLVKKPYSFPVGESVNDTVVKSIRDIPHMLIAGVTGYGKSVFFKQVLFSLLQTPRFQLYLIDLKRVESTEFEPFPNVKIVKTENEALNVLRALKTEMDRRYKLMEKLETNKLDPKRDNLDLITVAIDEASVLFGKTKVNKQRAKMVAEARELLEDLTKLARAAAVHVIVATQKPVDDSLDTNSLENLPGRMIFKMSTIPGSNAALGNKLAYKLPDIKGRGLWRDGGNHIQVQAPFISPEDLKGECKVLANKIREHKKWNESPMIHIVQSQNPEDDGLLKKTMKGNSGREKVSA